MVNTPKERNALPSDEPEMGRRGFMKALVAVGLGNLVGCGDTHGVDSTHADEGMGGMGDEGDTGGPESYDGGLNPEGSDAVDGGPEGCYGGPEGCYGGPEGSI